jgi:transcriptional regulator with XRE-family HTH domain
MTRQRNKAFDEAVGARIKERMATAKLSPGQVAEGIDKSEAQIFRYLNGTTHVEPADLARLAKLLGCKAGDFVDGIVVGK